MGQCVTFAVETSSESASRSSMRTGLWLDAAMPPQLTDTLRPLGASGLGGMGNGSSEGKRNHSSLRS